MEMTVDAEVGALVHQAMFRAGLSQTDVAPLLSITQSTLSKKLKGKITWSVGDLIVIAAALEVNPSELIPTWDVIRKDAPGVVPCPFSRPSVRDSVRVNDGEWWTVRPRRPSTPSVRPRFGPGERR